MCSINLSSEPIGDDMASWMKWKTDLKFSPDFLKGIKGKDSNEGYF